MKQDEHVIITNILNGDEQLYGLLIDRYKEGLYRHCFRFVRDENRAEDIAQETFIKAYMKLADFDRVHAFSTWLYKIATNIALSELRKKWPLTLDDDMVNLIISEMPGTEKSAMYQELHQAIEKLPDKHRTAVKLHYFQGKKYEQIAREMNTTTGSVKGWMSRAKQQLKEMLS